MVSGMTAWISMFSRPRGAIAVCGADAAMLQHRLAIYEVLAALRALGLAIFLWTAKDRQTSESLGRDLRTARCQTWSRQITAWPGLEQSLDHGPTQNHPGRRGPTAAPADLQTYSRPRLVDGSNSPLTAKAEIVAAPQALFVYLP